MVSGMLLARREIFTEEEYTESRSLFTDWLMFILLTCCSEHLCQR